MLNEYLSTYHNNFYINGIHCKVKENTFQLQCLFNVCYGLDVTLPRPGRPVFFLTALSLSEETVSMELMFRNEKIYNYILML